MTGAVRRRKPAAAPSGALLRHLLQKLNFYYLEILLTFPVNICQPHVLRFFIEERS